MVIFLYNLDIFVWIQYNYLAYTVFTLDPSNHVIKQLWCIEKGTEERYFLVLLFCGPVKRLEACQAWSVYLTTFFHRQA